MKTIEVTPDKDGRIILDLYGQKIEVQDAQFKDNVAIVKEFGDEYKVIRKVAKKATKKEEE